MTRLKKLSARSGFEPENHKHEACHATSLTIWVARYGLQSHGVSIMASTNVSKCKLCVIVAAASMTSLRGPRIFVIRRPPEVPETLPSDIAVSFLLDFCIKCIVEIAACKSSCAPGVLILLPDPFCFDCPVDALGSEAVNYI